MRGRFAPSPSGVLHLGNLRTALGAWLLARSAGSGFLLRIEDLDPDRSRHEHEISQLADLHMLGLDFDGDLVRQSERTDLYRAAFEQLRDQGLVYPCWCTRAEIRRAASAPHTQGQSDAYPGTCRDIGTERRRELERHRDRAPAWRLDARGERMGFSDRLHGSVEFEVDDFVLWRGDDVPAYNLAVVVDDADQGVEEVVRGEDLLSSASRQLLLCKLLSLKPLSYTHLPLMTGADGHRLSKRDGAVTLAERLEMGESVERVVGALAAGLGLLDEDRALSARELLEGFDPARLKPAARTGDSSAPRAPR